MNHLPTQANTVTIATAIFGAPILLAFVIGSLPALLPVLLFRWIAGLGKPAGFDFEIVSRAMPQAT